MWLVFSITMAYLFVIGIITYGWFALNKNIAGNAFADDVSVSVVIAVRNESANIQNILNLIVNQDYNSNFFDIIIINDHSTDNTLQLINNYITENTQEKIKVIEAIGNGKKNALREGISISTAELIVTTDGDCTVKPGWLKSIVNYYNSTNYKVILGPVVYENEESIIQKFFSLDFVSLVASGAGSCGAGLPLMGNGANIAFKRDAYIATMNEGNNEKYASGDDVFLIHNVTKEYGAKSIGFLRNSNAIVSTLPPQNIKQFIKQRSRWASKTTGYRLAWPITVALTVFLFNLFLFAMLIGSFFFTWLLPIYFLIIITKFLIDLPLVFNFLSFTKKTNLSSLFFILELIYPAYIVIAAVASTIFSFEWKGRDKLK
jgi:cellulose synthase/poly-beta-1,6-N-acetylglucosamine synthase-like glycosyltransferase